MADGDFLSEGSILDVFYGVGMSSGFLSAAEFDKKVETSSLASDWMACSQRSM